MEKKNDGVDTGLEEKKTNKAKAWFNWGIPRKTGEPLMSPRGFSLTQNPLYPNPVEDKLIELCKANGGEIKLMVPVTVRMNDGIPTKELSNDLFDFEVTAKEEAPAAEAK